MSIKIVLMLTTVLNASGIHAQLASKGTRLTQRSTNLDTGGSDGMAPARDPQIAVAEELDIARQRGTVEGFELFLMRHPDSALAGEARLEMEYLKKKARR